MRFILLCLSLLLSLLKNSRALDNRTACGKPGKPFDGDVFPSSKSTFENGQIVNYSCSSSDYLLGSVNRTCGPEGKWTGSVPRCLSPASVEDSVDGLVLVTGRGDSEFPDKSIYDRNPETCWNVFKHSSRLSIRINLIKTLVLKGVRLVFHTPDNPRFTVRSENSHCVESDSGKIKQNNDNRSQVTFDCSTINAVNQRQHLVFEEDQDRLGICEFFLFYQPDDSKCGVPDTPLYGEIRQISKDFTFHCDTGFALSGSNYTACARNRSWTKETPICKEKNEGNHTFQRKEKSRGMLFVYGVVAGALTIIVIGGIVIALYRNLRRRSAKRRYRDRANHSSQRSNSFEVSFRRERVPSVRYSASPGNCNKEHPELEDRPRSDIPDILGHKNVRSLATVRAMDITPSRAGSASGHIYAIPVGDNLEDNIGLSNQNRRRKSDFLMTDNEYYCTNT